MFYVTGFVDVFLQEIKPSGDGIELNVNVMKFSVT